MAFNFVNKDEFYKRNLKNEKTARITVEFELDTNNGHKPLPKVGLEKWTKEHTKDYGDMIIRNIRVRGEN